MVSFPLSLRELATPEWDNGMGKVQFTALYPSLSALALPSRHLILILIQAISIILDWLLLVASKRNVRDLSPSLSRRWGYGPDNLRCRVNQTLDKFVHPA